MKQPGDEAPHTEAAAARSSGGDRGTLLWFYTALLLMASLVVAIGYWWGSRPMMTVVLPEGASQTTQAGGAGGASLDGEYPEQQRLRLFATAITPAEVASLPKEGQDLYFHIDELVKKGLLPEAVQFIAAVLRSPQRALLAAKPLTVQCMQVGFEAGRRFEALRSWRAARQAYGLARSFDLNSSLLLYHEAMAALAMGSASEGRRLLLQAIKADRNNDAAVRALMRLEAGDRNLRRVRPLARQYLERHPDDPEAIELMELSAAAQQLPEGQDGRSGIRFEANGVILAAPVLMLPGVAAATRRIFETSRDILRSEGELSELPDISLLPVNEPARDNVRMNDGCKTLTTGVVEIPEQGFHPGLPFAIGPLVNSSVQAMIRSRYRGLVPCWAAHGLGSWMEERVAGAGPPVGLQMLHALLPWNELDRPVKGLLPDAKQTFYPQSHALMSLIIQRKGLSKALRCMGEAAHPDWRTSFFDCLNLNSESLMEETVRVYGGRR